VTSPVTELPSSPGGTRLIPRAACLVACVAFSLHFFLWAPRLTYGFAMYYTFARLALQGESLDRAYDDAYFQAKLREFGFDLRDEPNNIPTAGLAFMPVAWLPPTAARIAWSCISLASLAYALVLLFGISGIRAAGNTGMWLLTLVFLWKPAYDTVAFGQVYFLLLLLFALSMKGLMRDRVAGTSVPLSLAFLVKGYGIVPALLLALRRRWKEFGLAVAVTAGIIVATLPLFGIQAWSGFLSTVLPSLGNSPSSAHVAYQTINGFLRHFFTFDPVWAPHPLIVLPGAAVTVLSYGISTAAVILVLFRSRLGRGPDTFLSFGTALAAGVVTAPMAEEYHFVLFIPLIFALAAGFETPGRAGEWKTYGTLMAALAVLLMAAPLHYKGLQDSPFPVGLLAYPKLYSGLALLIYSCGVLKRSEPGAGHAAG